MAETPDPALPMASDNESLTQIESQALSELDAVANDDALERWRVAYLGRRGRLTLVLRGLADLPIEERRSVGAKANRLKQQLAADPQTSAWVEEDNLFRNYKLLQFCDTLALYFNLRHQSNRTVENYVHVPETVTRDAQITVTPVGNGTYSFDPFPFAGDALEVRCQGRYVAAISESPPDLGAHIRGLPVDEQIHRFVAA